MSDKPAGTAEGRRLEDNTRRTAHWNRWGPYLSERAWGTVREDYSADGAAWDYFPHDHARSRAYRWNEDGLGGVCDRHQLVCFALALWNGRDPILKERPFGLTNAEGNHGEDVKEYWFYLDSTPTHSFMRYLYKYPQAEYPYRHLLEENRRRGIDDPEYELLDTGIFDGGRYFDVEISYAKASPEDLLVEITAFNRGPDAAPIDLLPTVWFRNTWSWRPGRKRPLAAAADRPGGRAAIVLDEAYLGRRYLHVEAGAELLFTENETNAERVFGSPNASPYVKDAFHEYVIRGNAAAVNPARRGTKAAARRRVVVPAGGSTRVRLRLTDAPWESGDPLGEEFERVFADRRREADDFYGALIPASLTPDEKNVMRQAFAGMLWSKQFYKYDVGRWLDGDPLQPPPPASRKTGRNSDWRHVFNADVLSMPDTWEFPWYAAWDLAFHGVVFSLLDPNFAKDQLVLMLREWYMHPNGQIPAYEWNFADVNPPVHAWAALRVFQIERAKTGKADRAFLERVFHKLLLNFDWWVNRKDALGNNIFQGGFLGLDNIGIFDRNMKLPDGWVLSQADGTSWMAMYCLNLLGMALELAAEDPVYEDVASKFWEHFVYIAHAIQRPDQPELGLWDERDGFFYDEVHHPDGRQIPIRVRSLVGLLPLTAVVVGDSALIDRFPSFKRRMEWFFAHRQDLTSACASMTQHGREERILMSVVRPEQLARVLRYMLDESEFLSPYGLRSVSRYHHDHPYRATTAYGQSFGLDYEPGESRTKLFGGNSNWRGPIWFPLNYLILESLKRYHLYFGDAFKIECPTGSGRMMNLHEVSQELARRLSRIFVADAKGRRAVFGDRELFRSDPHWKDLLLFHEYFHGDTGLGLGASHQTGWTGLVAKVLDELGNPLARPTRG
ncbi:MAG TPA: glucosidase [Thermoanaerobaculia bacterium]|nr:glucosidase [Thermoanaerobaculia bacterium]